MSFFTSTHNLTVKTPLPASATLESAIGLLHDHTTFQNLQPLVTSNVITSNPPSTSHLAKTAASICPSGMEPEYRSVTAAIPMGPFGSSSVTTTSAFMDTEDGLKIAFQAPLGLSGWVQWKIISATSEDGTKNSLVLLEEATLTGLRPLMPFIVKTDKKSHGELGLAFAKKLEELTGASDVNTA